MTGSARALAAKLGINLESLQRANYSRIAEVCRNTPGSCFCGVHITELNDVTPRDPVPAVGLPECIEEAAYNAWGREAAEHVGSIMPWADLPPGIKRSWSVALAKAHELTVPDASDIIATYLGGSMTSTTPVSAILGMIEMARLLGLMADDEALLWKSRAVAVSAKG